MPVLEKWLTPQETQDPLQRRRTTAFFPACVNSRCASSWLHIWRSRTTPVIEGGWSCSPGCTRAWIAELVHRERVGHTHTAAMHRHRIPIGLVLLTEGWITHNQLRRGLEAQKQKTGTGVRIGSWLMEHCGLEERRVTQALSIQWNCPILSLDGEHNPPSVSLIPRLFLDSFGFIPLRISAAGILYIAFEDRIDHSLTLAIERMTGLSVVAGLVTGSEYQRAHDSVLAGRFPRARIVEAASLEAIIDALTVIVEKTRPLQARIVRIHGFYWLRLWRKTDGLEANVPTPVPDGVEDVICSLARFQ